MKAKTLHRAKSFLTLAGLFIATLAIAAGLNSSQASPAQAREVRIVNVSATTGQNVNVAVELVSQGNENAIGFSLNFNPAVLSAPATVPGNGAAGAMLNVNPAQVANGRLGVALALSTGQTFAAGTRQLIVVTFTVAGNAAAGSSPITFGDQPIAREISDVTANTLTSAFTAGAVTVQQPNPVPVLNSLNPASATAGSSGITLTVNGSNFAGNSEVRWNNSPRTTTFVSATQLTATIPSSDLVAAGTATVTVVSPAPGGGTSNSLTFTINNPAPTITSLSPNAVTAGGTAFTLTVNGSGFVNGSTVQWNGSPRTTTFGSATQLTAAIPASDIATAGTANVTVNSPAPGGGTSAAATFTINNPTPSITTLNPNSATTGGAAFTLTVNGSGFVNGSTVRWNGSARTTTFGSATQLTAAIPATDIASNGSAIVTVVNPAPGGGTSNSASFTINQSQNPVPTITTLNPSSATAGGAAFTLTINGTNFINDSTVWWNGGFRTTTFVSATQLTAAIPATDIATAGTASVTVTNPAPGGGTTAAATFTINNPAPTLTSLNPNSAAAGGAAFTLTLNGSGFVNSSTVWWNGSQRTTTFVNATQLTAAIPASDIATAGTASVSVNNPAPGGGSSNNLSFTINNPAPTLTNISPNSATAGGAAFILTVNGSGFVNGSTVQWNGSSRTTTFVSATQLTAAIPATDIASAGTANVTVNNPTPGGGISNAVTFTINQQQNPVPAITTISPNSATTGGAAFSLTVNGSNFINGSTVRWNGNARTTTFVSATQLTAAIPASDIASAGTASVTVVTATPGGGTSNAVSFTINAAAPSPIITGINPVSVVAGTGAFTMTVIGANFVNNSTVHWNGNARTTTFASATQLTAIIPATDIITAGVASVTVVTPAPGGGTSNAQTFSIVNRVTSVSAASFLGNELAAESIVAAFGVAMATGVAIADTQPLPTTLLGTKVAVRDSLGVERLSPLFFVAPSQVNYLIPAGTANGTATIVITSGDNTTSVGTQQISTVAPGLFTANASGVGVPAANVFRLTANGAQSFESFAMFDSSLGRFVPRPIDLGPEGDQVFALLFGTGFRFNGALSSVSVKIGGVDCEVLYAADAPGFIGLDQCNARIPRSLLGRGEVDLVITVNGKIANTVRVNIK
jgi:uncharacterized protein (TIGR03437 family)